MMHLCHDCPRSGNATAPRSVCCKGENNRVVIVEDGRSPLRAAAMMAALSMAAGASFAGPPLRRQREPEPTPHDLMGIKSRKDRRRAQKLARKRSRK